MHKRLAERPERRPEQRKADFETTIFAYEKGYDLNDNYYDGINLAFLLDTSADQEQGEDRMADRVLARRVRERLVRRLERQIAEREGEETTEELREEGYWMRATMAGARRAWRRREREGIAGQGSRLRARALGGIEPRGADGKAAPVAGEGGRLGGAAGARPPRASRRAASDPALLLKNALRQRAAWMPANRPALVNGSNPVNASASARSWVSTMMMPP